MLQTSLQSVYEVRIGGGETVIDWVAGGVRKSWFGWEVKDEGKSWFLLTMIIGIPSSSESDSSMLLVAVSTEAGLKTRSRMKDDGMLKKDV